jgi:putative DNA primase/helicase
MSADGEVISFGSGRRMPRAPSDDELSRYDLNDFGNAMRLIRLVGGDVDEDGGVDLRCARLLYLRDAGWIGFDPGRGAWDLLHGARQATRMAHKVAQGLFPQLQLRVEALDSDVSARTIKDILGFAEQCGNRGRTASMLAQAEAYLQVDLEDFDKDPLTLAVRNGTLRFRRGRDGPKMRFDPYHDPGDRLTRIAAADYIPDAPAALWLAKLEEWLPEEPRRRYVQRLTGYSATGCTEEQKIFIFQGLGNDGKSTYVAAIRDTLGQGEYAATADVKTFLDTGMRSAGDASPDMARLAGDTRLVCVSEPPRGSKLNDGLIKSFTGGAPVLARRLRQDPFEFTPRGKVLMEANIRPNPSGDDEGIWRRISLVLWKNPVPKEKVDKRLGSQLAEERSGILNWIVAGVMDWLAQGLAEPPEVAEALDDYRKGASPFSDWFLERLDISDREAIEGATELYTDFKEWMERNGHEKVISQKIFGQALGDRQVLLTSKHPDTGRKRRKGARLRPLWETGAPAADEAGGPGGQSLGGPEAVPLPGEEDIDWSAR